MTHAILFDLDNTLLSNDMDRFIPAYMKLISSYAAEHCKPALLVKHLLAATKMMAENTDPAISNEKAFWDTFAKLTGFDPDQMIPFFHRFYETDFTSLAALTGSRPQASELVAWALASGYRVVIATNPMFPKIAVEQRLKWAGIEHYDYDLITAYENMHATKPHQQYYREILASIDCPPEEAVMVGDDWEMDILPSSRVGIRAFWISSPAAAKPNVAAALPLIGQGSLADFWALAQSGQLESI